MRNEDAKPEMRSLCIPDLASEEGSLVATLLGMT
jgi:hypothetical protein